MIYSQSTTELWSADGHVLIGMGKLAGKMGGNLMIARIHTPDKRGHWTVLPRAVAPYPVSWAFPLSRFGEAQQDSGHGLGKMFLHCLTADAGLMVDAHRAEGLEVVA